MKIKSITVFLTCWLSLSSLTVPAIACDCVPGCSPSACEACEDGVCVYQCSAANCETCNEGSCIECFYSSGMLCEECVGGSCVDICPLYNLCLECDGIGSCVSECDSCEECVEDHCISCAALGKVCCDGECREPCDEEIDEPRCRSEWNDDCIACVGFLEYCSHDYTRIFTNAVTYTCSGGCDGDCAEEENQPVCSTVYKCKTAIVYDFDACGIGGEMPGSLDCYPAGMPWTCKTCTTDYDERISVHYPPYPSKKCQ